MHWRVCWEPLFEREMNQDVDNVKAHSHTDKILKFWEETFKQCKLRYIEKQQKCGARNQGSMGTPFWLAERIVRLGRDCTHVPWQLNFFFFFFPTRPQMVRFGPKQSKIGSNLGRNTYKRNVNFKINFYLVEFQTFDIVF